MIDEVQDNIQRHSFGTCVGALFYDNRGDVGRTQLVDCALRKALRLYPVLANSPELLSYVALSVMDGSVHVAGAVIGR